MAPKKREYDSMTPLMRAFCYEYLVDGDATRSVIAAGYSVKGAASTAVGLLKDRRVISFLEGLNGDRFKQLKKEKDKVRKDEVKGAIDKGLEVIRRLDNMASANIGDHFEEDFIGRVVAKPLERMKNIGSIKSIKVDEFGKITELKTESKIKANHLLGQHYNLFNHKQELDINLNNKMDLSQLSDDELGAFQTMLEKIQS